MDKIDDYSTYKNRDGSIVEAAETVVLVVRPGHKYDKTLAGGRVRVAKADLEDKSTMRVCMTIEEFSEVEAAREKRRLEKQKPKVSRLKATVEAAIGALPPREKK